MSQLISVTISEEFSPLGGQVIYLNYKDGSIRVEAPFGVEDTYLAHGVPVLVGGQALS